MAAGFLRDKRNLTIASIVVAFVFLFALNAFSNSVVQGIAFDFTEDQEFTLSPGTRKVLTNLQEPVTLRLFISPSLTEKVPSYAAAAERVRNLLDRYQALAQGKLRLEVYEPEPFSEAEDKAAAYGIQGIPLDQEGQKVYFGLAATNSVDEEKKIPFFHPSRTRFIEYDLTRLIAGLGLKKRVVGVISSLPIRGSFSMRGGATPPWEIMNQIEDVYEVKTLSDIDKVPEDVDVLMIVHPGDLDDKTLYAIDQYVLRGGRALVMVDPVPEAAPRRRNAMGRPGPVGPPSDLNKLLASWGVKYDKTSVATDASRYVRVPHRAGGQVVYAPHIGYLQLREGEFNDEDPVTADLSTMIFGIAGHLAKAEGAKTEVEPLVWTTDKAAARTAAPFRSPQPDLVDLYRGFQPGDKRLLLAVRVTGTPETAFPGGLKTAEKKDDDEKGEATKAADEKKDAKAPSHLAAAAKPTNIIVVADIDMLQENFWAQKQNAGESEILVPFANNADFVTNALDSLSGNDALIQLRSRGSPSRPFTVVEELRKESGARLREKQKELSEKLKEVREKIEATRTKRQDDDQVMTEADQAALRNHMSEFLRIRREQRQVMFALREDVEALEARTKFYNIALIPIVIALIAILVAVLNARRRRRRHDIS